MRGEHPQTAPTQAARHRHRACSLRHGDPILQPTKSQLAWTYDAVPADTRPCHAQQVGWRVAAWYCRTYCSCIPLGMSIAEAGVGAACHKHQPILWHVVCEGCVSCLCVWVVVALALLLGTEPAQPVPVRQLLRGGCTTRAQAGRAGWSWVSCASLWCMHMSSTAPHPHAPLMASSACPHPKASQCIRGLFGKRAHG